MIIERAMSVHHPGARAGNDSTSSSLLVAALAAALEQVPVPLALIDGAGRVVHANEALAACVGAPVEELQGRSWHEALALSPAGGEAEGELAIAIKARRHTCASQIAVGRAHKTIHPITFSPIDLADEPYGLLVCETPPPTGRQLPFDLIASVSHELRTPLTAVKGCASMLRHERQGLDDERQTELLRIIDEQADRLSDLIDGMSDLSKLQAGTLRLRRKLAPISTLVEKVRAGAEGRGRRIAIGHVPDHVPAVEMDVRRLEQVCLGLLDALETGGKTGGSVTLDLDAANGEVTVSLATPASINAMLLRDGGGQRRLRLQLSLAQGIAAAHGGRLVVESGEEGGSAVRLVLPTAAQQALPVISDPLRSSEPVPQAASPRASGPRAHVLLIVQDARLQRLVVAALEGGGYVARTVTSPSLAIETVVAARPELVVLDLSIEQGDALVLCRQLRDASTVGIIALMSKDSGVNRAGVLDLGADDCLIKPLDPVELLARARAVLRRFDMSGERDGNPIFALGALRVDLARRRVTVNGQELTLSATEYKLLRQLAMNAGRVLVHEELLAQVWGTAYRSDVENLRSYVRRLRRKLGDDPANPSYILTQAGVGYSMRSPHDDTRGSQLVAPASGPEVHSFTLLSRR